MPDVPGTTARERPPPGAAAPSTRPPAAAPITSAVDPLDGIGTTQRLRRGSLIVAEGHPADDCFAVRAGTVRVYRTLVGGRV